MIFFFGGKSLISLRVFTQWEEKKNTETGNSQFGIIY